ncbi:PIN domain-containing protein [Streptomyces sp. NBC_01538]|uniref:PIN domain-containing protein n=1 Tax=Streptomyces sp. NBC_01538 TaxID=2903897 RepID=UPI003867A612
MPPHRIRDGALRPHHRRGHTHQHLAPRFDYLRCEEDTFARALETQRHALNAGFHRALSLPDLLIAATAELHRLTVLHYDGDFDMIGGITGQPTLWVVPPRAPQTTDEPPGEPSRDSVCRRASPGWQHTDVRTCGVGCAWCLSPPGPCPPRSASSGRPASPLPGPGRGPGRWCRGPGRP